MPDKNCVCPEGIDVPVTGVVVSIDGSNFLSIIDELRNEFDKKLADIEAQQTSAYYELCEFYYFRNPTLKPGFLPAEGGLIEDAATLYPEAWAYLQTAECQKLCKSEEEWQSLTQAIWHTNTDGTTVGWEGIGGAPFYAPDAATGALRLPDLRGMYIEAAGFDGLDVGGVHGDAIRNITGRITTAGAHAFHPNAGTGAFYSGANQGSQLLASSGAASSYLNINSSRIVPTANKNQPRAWGALACVYLGRPSA